MRNISIMSNQINCKILSLIYDDVFTSRNCQSGNNVGGGNLHNKFLFRIFDDLYDLRIKIVCICVCMDENEH